MAKTFHSIPWDRLLSEFSAYGGDPEELTFQPRAFVESLVAPVPPFVEYFLNVRTTQGQDYEYAVRDLYFFLLKKRYEERMNLLHFAFCIFDDATHLPDVIIDRTPFPHEDGQPRFGDPTLLKSFSPANIA
jgi:hypothetical protein